jgi:hypothetical protein
LAQEGRDQGVVKIHEYKDVITWFSGVFYRIALESGIRTLIKTGRVDGAVHFG